MCVFVRGGACFSASPPLYLFLPPSKHRFKFHMHRHRDILTLTHTGIHLEIQTITDNCFFLSSSISYTHARTYIYEIETPPSSMYFSLTLVASSIRKLGWSTRFWCCATQSPFAKFPIAYCRSATDVVINPQSKKAPRKDSILP
jgi:hypothetical protein